MPVNSSTITFRDTPRHKVFAALAGALIIAYMTYQVAFEGRPIFDDVDSPVPSTVILGVLMLGWSLKRRTVEIDSQRGEIRISNRALGVPSGENRTLPLHKISHIELSGMPGSTPAQPSFLSYHLNLVQSGEPPAKIELVTIEGSQVEKLNQTLAQLAQFCGCPVKTADQQPLHGPNFSDALRRA